MMTTAKWAAPVLGAAMALGCAGGSETAREDAGPAATLRLHQVGLDEVSRTHEASGTLEAQQTAVLTSRVPGYIQEVRVRAGERVDAGQVLVVIDGAAIRAQLDAALAARDEAEAGEAEASDRVAAAEAQAELARTTYERIVKLAEQNAVTTQELDEASSRRLAADAGLGAAKSGLRRVQAGRARASAQVAAAEAQWADTSVRAPYAGRIIERHVDVGNFAAPGTPLLVLEQQGELAARVSVDEAYAGRIPVGMEVEVRVEAGDGARLVAGVVREVSPSIDPVSRAFAVEIDLKDSADDERLAPGRFVRALFPMGTAERLRVPESAIVRRGQLEFVYAVDDGRARLRLVTLGRERDGFVEVLSGLDDGDSVVATATEVPEEGALVEASS